jgi:hypothetical protein
MPFPFYPVGALVASAILAVALTIFVVALRAIDRAVTRIGGSVVSGLVAGFDGWSAPRQAPAPASVSPGTAGEEPAAPVPVVPVQRRWSADSPTGPA